MSAKQDPVTVLQCVQALTCLYSNSSVECAGSVYFSPSCNSYYLHQVCITSRKFMWPNQDPVTVLQKAVVSVLFHCCLSIALLYAMGVYTYQKIHVAKLGSCYSFVSVTVVSVLLYYMQWVCIPTRKFMWPNQDPVTVLHTRILLLLSILEFQSFLLLNIITHQYLCSFFGYYIVGVYIQQENSCSQIRIQ